MNLAPGVQLGPYRIVRPLGSGGMGVVYEARDPRLERTVAIKLLPPHSASDKSAEQRFRREARAASALDHPSICTIYDIDETADGQTYLVMAYYDGETLQQRIDRGPLGLVEALEVARQVGLGLERAHAAGIVHRDIKPANLILTRDETVKILDFGLAKLTHSERITLPGTAVGTMAYMSPEQVRGEDVDHRSDIWSLGVVLYEMLLGRPPFKRDDLPSTFQAILEPAPVSLTNAPAPAQVILERALHKDRKDRYQAVTDLLADLARVRSVATADAAATTAISTAVSHPRIPSIAVLPFVNMSADPEQEYFCDGMAEEIINALAQVEDLRVVARTSAFSFKGKNKDIRTIGRTLDVETVLEGSVRKAGDNLRITAQLVNVADGYHLWSERYNRVLADVFAIQDEISLAIVEKLEGKLLTANQQSLVHQPTDNVEAYQLYLRGRFHRHKWNPMAMQEAVSCYRQATELDPRFAHAYLGLAEVYVGMTPIGGMDALTPAAARPLARDAVRKALELDRDLVEAQCLERFVRGAFDGDWSGADEEFDRFTDRLPSAGEFNYWVVLFYFFRKRFEDALALLETARASDPLSPFYLYLTGFAFFLAGRFDEAIDTYRHLLAMEPDYYMGNLLLGAVYARLGRYKEALERYQKLIGLFGREPLILDHQARLFGLWGKREEARKLVEELELVANERHVGPAHFVWTSVALGERQKALEHLTRAWEEKDPLLPFVLIWPWPQIAELEGEREVREIRRRMGLED